jgi:hypothetical protein
MKPFPDLYSEDLSVQLRPGAHWPVRSRLRLILANQRSLFEVPKVLNSAFPVKYTKTTPILT